MVSVTLGRRSNCAVTVFVPVAAIVHVGELPEHAPPQRVNFDPVAGVAVSVTLCPSGYAPPPVTVPWPLPVVLVVIVGSRSNVAVAVPLCETVNEHADEVRPAHRPAHEANLEPDAGAACSTATWPC